MLKDFPTEYTLALDWQWADWQVHYQALMDAEVTAETVEDWLLQWAQVNRLATEVSQRLNVAKNSDTGDEVAEARYKNFVATIVPEIEKASFALNKKLVAVGHVPAGLETPMRNIKTEIAIFREENLPLQTQLSDLAIEGSKIMGAQTVEWDGEEVTIKQLQSVFEEQDRERRKKAWLLMQDRLMQDHAALNRIWRQSMAIRKQMAANAGFDNYRDFVWQVRQRHDYTPDDALAFTAAIADVVVPAAARLREQGRQALGHETLRPWDMSQHAFAISVDTKGRAALIPYDTMEEFIERGRSIFEQVDPELGQFFGTMQAEQLLDLENRKGKAPGGYCTMYPTSRRPFIFMNAAGLAQDVRTLLHESGHAFHVFSMVDLPYFHLQGSFGHVPLEFAEVGSMAMELLASPYLTKEQGGYFEAAEAARYRIEHLRGILYFWPYMAVVVEFQHWIYTHHEAATDPANCDAKWIELWNRFIPGIDWSGYEHYIPNRWRRQGHIFRVPFYYIEYGLAQLGAVQVWANALDNPQQALAAYRHALTLGSTVPLPQLFEAAGAKLAFDADTLQRAVELIEKTIAEMEALEQ